MWRGSSGNGMSMGSNGWTSSHNSQLNIKGFNQINNPGKQNLSMNDEMLQSHIEQIFQNYDMNSSGQLESREFFFVYRTLCLKMGVSPPSSLQEVQQAAIEADNNGNGSISKMELFTLFKKMQLNAGKGINMGGMGSTGGMGGMGGMGGVAPQQPQLQSNPFNRWAVPNYNYQTLKGFTAIDYTGGWNANVHDQLLKSNIDAVFQRYDRDKSGFLESQKLFFAYRDLCLKMGLCPPQSIQEFAKVFKVSDFNDDDRISRQELFNFFKKIQHVNVTC